MAGDEDIKADKDTGHKGWVIVIGIMIVVAIVLTWGVISQLNKLTKCYQNNYNLDNCPEYECADGSAPWDFEPPPTT